MKKFLIAAAAAALSIGAAQASPTQIVLTPSSVVGSSGYYTACCSFQPGNIFDQQTGTVTESFGAGYWLNPDNGPANAYITIDLGSIRSLSSLSLYNTHNGPYADRGTGAFSFYGSNTISGGQLVAPTLITSGTLTPETAGNPTAQNFAATGAFRYISFNPTSVAVGGSPCCGANVYGLDELRVSAVPEPAIWGMMIAGFGLVGGTMRRRSAKIAFA